MMNGDGLTILQWNCRDIYRKLSELKKYLATFTTRPDLRCYYKRHISPTNTTLKSKAATSFERTNRHLVEAQQYLQDTIYKSRK